MHALIEALRGQHGHVDHCWTTKEKEVGYENLDGSDLPRLARKHRAQDWFLAQRKWRRHTMSSKISGAEITLASPKGGRPPLDPKSNEPNFRTDLTRRFEKDADANAQLDRTVRLDSVKQEDYDTVFYPGGHGPMWDLADDKNSVKLLESVVAAGKTFAVVCHSTGALRHVRTPDGKIFVEGKTVTGFTNGEEDEVQLTKVVPFLVEDEMMRLGATFSKVKNWAVHGGRRTVDHRPEPGFIGSGCQASDRCAEEGEPGRGRSLKDLERGEAPILTLSLQGQNDRRPK